MIQGFRQAIGVTGENGAFRMAYEEMTRHHKDAALREEQAAASAVCEESYRCHSALADLHRKEAYKRASITDTLRIAFGD